MGNVTSIAVGNAEQSETLTTLAQVTPALSPAAPLVQNQTTIQLALNWLEIQNGKKAPAIDITISRFDFERHLFDRILISARSDNTIGVSCLNQLITKVGPDVIEWSPVMARSYGWVTNEAIVADIRELAQNIYAHASDPQNLSLDQQAAIKRIEHKIFEDRTWLHQPNSSLHPDAVGLPPAACQGRIGRGV